MTDAHGLGLSAPIVTLTTDFGLTEPFVGLVKARILAACSRACIVDLTHAIAPHAIEAGAFWIERCSGYFPAGTIHLGIVDPGVGTARRIVAVRCGGQAFLGPDNGLLAAVASKPGAEVRWVDDPVLRQAGLRGASATFHGRDILGPLTGLLAAGALAFEDLGPPTTRWLRPDWPPPQATPGRLLGRVVLIDRFGNCFSNITAESLKLVEEPQVLFAEHSLPLVRTYGDRPPGTAVALVNSFEVLEAACVEGSAADALQLRPGSPVEIRERQGRASRAC